MLLKQLKVHVYLITATSSHSVFARTHTLQSASGYDAVRASAVPSLCRSEAWPPEWLVTNSLWLWFKMKVDKETSFAGPVDSKPILSDRKGSLKVTITPAQHKTLTHLPKRPPVDLAFSDLTYRVQEGRKSSKYYHCSFFASDEAFVRDTYCYLAEIFVRVHIILGFHFEFLSSFRDKIWC